MRILVVEDEENISHFVRQGLEEAGFAVDVARDGKTGFEYAIALQYDVMILDIMLPGMDGLALLRELRSRDISTPVIFLTARDTVEDRVLGLNAGADDYLVKPFAFSELLARVRTLMRRPPLQVQTTLEVGGLKMDTLRREVRRGSRIIDLSTREFALLEYLMRHPDHVLSRTQIGEHVWNIDYYHESNIVDVYIGYLRRKVDKGSDQPLIHTVRGVGYRLSARTESE